MPTIGIQQFFTEQNKENIDQFSSTKEEIKQSHFTKKVDFYASTIWREKTWRMINNSIGACVLIHVVRKISFVFPKGVNAAASELISIATKGAFKALKERAPKIIESLSPAISKISPLALFYLKVGLFLYVARKVVALIPMVIIYPATLTFTSYKINYPEEFFDCLEKFKKEGYLIKRVLLEKSGSIYEGFLIGHKDTIHNGNWSIHAVGNGMSMEDVIWEYPVYVSENHDYVRINRQIQSNCLFINGPMVGRNWSLPTRFGLGAGYEAGLQFLEKVVGAKRIVIDGQSLGGGMMAEAILQHDFSEGQAKGIKYMNVSRVTFDRLSHIAAVFVRIKWVTPLLKYGLGVELDNIAASDKLRDLKIKHVIINNIRTEKYPLMPFNGDGLIAAHVALANHVKKDETKEILIGDDFDHNSPGRGNYGKVGQEFGEQLNDFFAVEPRVRG